MSLPQQQLKHSPVGQCDNNQHTMATHPPKLVNNQHQQHPHNQHQHQQQLKRSPVGQCNNHQHTMATHLPKLVNNQHQHHPHNQHSNPSHHHQSHCVHHRAHASHQNHQHAQQQHCKLQRGNLCQQQHLNGASELSIRREREREREHHHRPANGEDLEESGRRRARRRRANTMAELIVHQQQQPTSKRTTMRFISQLYFLIHLSALLSLLLHHKNLVTNETWRLASGQPLRTSLAQENNSPVDPVIHMAKRHNNETTTSQMPSPINQLPIPLMLSSPSPSSQLSGTISSFVPYFEESQISESIQQQQQHPVIGPARGRRTLPIQMLVTPAMGLHGADILVRLFGYRHARRALHYFLAYLLSSSITMLVCLRLFRQTRSRSDCYTCRWSGRESGSLAGASAESNMKSSPTTTLGGFYYRTRLDCTPVLVGSISLGLIQLIVIGLDIAAKVDWLSPSSSSPSSSSDSNESRWPIYLPFLQFAFVSLLMQYILGKVAKNNDRATTAAAAASSRETPRYLANARLPINGHTTATKRQPLLLLLQPEQQLITTTTTSTQQHQMEWKHQHHHHHHRHQTENNGKRRISGLQNIALAHLLVTHILLWLMKLNSISLFQAIERHPPYSYPYSSPTDTDSHSSRTRSRSLLLMPPPSLPSNNHDINLIEHPRLATDLADVRLRQSTPASTLSSQQGERDIDRAGREFNQTERERLLRPTVKSTAQPSNKLSATTNISATQQVLQLSNEGQQQRRPSSSQANQAGSESRVANTTYQRAPQTEPQLKSEWRGHRSASPMERPVTSSPADRQTNNDSIVISKSQLANLLELATKNVQRFQVPPAAAGVATATAPTSTPMKTTTATTSSTTARPQFKSSIPKRMTAFRQIQKPILLLSNRTIPSPITSTSTTTTAMPTTTRMSPPDVTEIVNSAPPKKVPVRIQVSRDGENELVPKEVPLADNDPTLDYYPKVSTSDDYDDAKFRRQLGTGRPFPSVEGDPPPGSHTYTDSEQEATTSSDDDTRLIMPTEPAPTGSDNNNDISAADESEDSDLELLLPPVPNYAGENETGSEPDEQSSQISLSFRSPQSNSNLTERNGIIGAPTREALFMAPYYQEQEDQLAESSTNRDEHHQQQQQQPTFSDYLLPIVYQYHILIIAILFNMWLDSLRTTTSPLVAADQSKGQLASISLSSPTSELSSRRHLVRSRSVESELERRSADRRRNPRHNQRTATGWEETSSITGSGSNLSRSNSLRASSDRLLWVSGNQHQQRPQRQQRSRPKRRHQPDDCDSAASLSSLGSRSPEDAPVRHQMQMMMQASHQRAGGPTSSACSVFFGLLVVSAALIVILLGVELLTILNQCATQLISILVCLVGLGLAWRSQSRIRRADLVAAARFRQAAAFEGAHRRLQLSCKGAAFLTNPHDILLSGRMPAKQQSLEDPASDNRAIRQPAPQLIHHQVEANLPPIGSTHRQCFHYLFLLAAYFCGVSVALNLGKQHSVQQLFPPQVMHFLQRHWNQASSSSRSGTSQAQGGGSNSLFQNWGYFWSMAPPLAGEPLSPLILFHVVLASKGLLLIVQVTLQTILIRSSCSQRATRQLRQVYTFLMFSNLSLWAMDIYEQQQHLQRQDYGTSSIIAEDVSFVVDRLRLITLEGFTQFASSIVTLSHLYHGLVFMQH